MPYPPCSRVTSQNSRKNSKVIQLFLKHERDEAEAGPQDSLECCPKRVLGSSDIVKPVTDWGLSDYVAMYGAEYTSEDDGSLTEMMTEHKVTHPSDPDKAAYRRNISLIS